MSPVKKLRLAIIISVASIAAITFCVLFYIYVVNPNDYKQLDAKASEVISDFYTEYNNVNSRNNVDSASLAKGQTEKTAIIKKYGTTNLIEYYNHPPLGIDPVLCMNESYQSSMTTGPKVRGSSFYVKVKNEVVRESVKDITVNFVQVGNEIKIDSITCS